MSTTYKDILSVSAKNILTASVGGSGTLGLDRKGGAGFPEALSIPVIAYFKDMETPFGAVPMVKLLDINGFKVVRVPLHGWRFPETTLEQTLATFWLLDKIGVQQVIVDASVGGIRAKPWDIVIPDDVINNNPAKIAASRLAFELGKDPWVRMAKPFCLRLGKSFVQPFADAKLKYPSLGNLIEGGTYYTMPLGPFETAAEIKMLQNSSMTIIGQSSGQEALCARICGMCLAVINPVANFAEGINDGAWTPISGGMDEIYRQMAMPMAQIVINTLRQIVKEPRSCDCAKIAKSTDLSTLTA